MEQRTLAFIGAGNMSRAIISGLISSGYPAKCVIASNPSTPKLDALHADFGIRTTQDNIDAVKHADVVVLAVKPQLMETVCAELAACSALADKVFVSIAAGIPLARLQQMLGGDYHVVRTMPNTPSAIGLGMTGLYAEPSLADKDKTYAGALMQSVGEILWVQDEAMLDAVIAAAGSSPAYFFLFLEAMQAEAERMGFDHRSARQLVQQAMRGTAEMVCHNPDLELAALRAQVTSKGGTTAKAIETFQQHGLEDSVAQAMQAAVARAKQMSQQF